MSYDESDAEYEEGMSILYEEFKQSFENNFIIERIDTFYKENPSVIKESLCNLVESKSLLEKGFFTAAFLHSIISIETGIKSVAIKPILYSLTIDNNAGDLLYKHTFKQKSLQDIPNFYYQILKETTELDFKTIYRENTESTIWNEWGELQYLRNKVVHQGVFVESSDTGKAIEVAVYVCEEIIPSILDKYLCHIEEDVIKTGSREYMKRTLNLSKNK